MGFHLTAIAIVLLLLVSLLFKVLAVIIDDNNNNNNIKINNEDIIIKSGLAGWLASVKAIVSSLLRGTVQAPWEKGMSPPPILILIASSSSSSVSISHKIDF